MEMPGHVASLAPGMTQVIVAGETYTLKDDKGEELELKGTDDPWTVEFLAEFDTWQTICKTLGHGSDAATSQYSVLLDKWGNMPDRLFTGMPSIKAGGIVVPGRSVHLDH